MTTLVDTEGRKIQVEVLALDGDQVKINFNGKEIALPMERLNEESKQQVKSVLETQAKEHEVKLAERMQLPNGEQIVPGKLQTFYLVANDEDRKASNCEALVKIKVSVAFPEGFDPDKKWPVFFASDTGGANNWRAANTYYKAATQLGYVVIGAGGEAAPGADKDKAEALTYWDARGLVTARAIGALAERWPLIIESDWSHGGFSGGTKNCCFLAVYLFEVYEIHPVGFYMGGCNEMKMSHAIENYKSSKTPFRKTAFYISNGDTDGIAGPEKGEMVEDLLNKDGFRNSKRFVYQGGHTYFEPHFIQALEWFKEHAADYR